MNLNNLNEGSKIPEFSLEDFEDKLYTNNDFNGKTFILYFYPKDDTPGCTKEACDFRDNYKAFQDLGIQIVGISGDSKESHNKFIQKYNLPFLLLSDPNKEICKKFDVIKEKQIFGKKYLGIQRSTFIIDKNQTIVKIFKNVKVLSHVNEILKVIHNLNLKD